MKKVCMILVTILVLVSCTARAEKAESIDLYDMADHYLKYWTYDTLDFPSSAEDEDAILTIYRAQLIETQGEALVEKLNIYMLDNGALIMQAWAHGYINTDDVATILYSILH